MVLQFITRFRDRLRRVGEPRTEKSINDGGIDVTELDAVRGIPALQLVQIILKLGTFAHEQAPKVPMGLWDVVMDRTDAGIALYAVAPDPEDADAEYVAYWRFETQAWVWDL